MGVVVRRPDARNAKGDKEWMPKEWTVGMRKQEQESRSNLEGALEFGSPGKELSSAVSFLIGPSAFASR